MCDYNPRLTLSAYICPSQCNVARLMDPSCLSAGPLPGAANHPGSPQQMGGRASRETHIPALVDVYRQHEGVPCAPEADTAVHPR